MHDDHAWNLDGTCAYKGCDADMRDDGVVAFIRARLIDWEQAARAVEPLDETIDMGGNRLPHSFSHTRNTYASEDGMPRRQSDPAAKAHFDLHDPGRVLAQVAAMRAIVDLHDAGMSRIQPRIRLCPSCAAGHPEHFTEHGCITLRHVAAIWSSHPEYDPAWAPDA